MIDWLLYISATLVVCFCLATAFSAERSAKDALQKQTEKFVKLEAKMPVLEACKTGACEVTKSIKQNKPARSVVKSRIHRGLFWRLRRR